MRTILAAWALGMMLLASAHAWAENAQLVAVLPVEQAPDTGLTQSELNDLTALARGTAADVLGDQFIVMTEQNMQRILKGMGLTLEKCQAEAGDCAVEIARKLQADHVVTGKVRSAFGKLTLNLELYATENGDLIVSRRVSVKAKEEFEEKIRPAMASTLMKLPGRSSGGGLDFQLQERRDTRGSNWKSSGASLAVVKFQSTPPGATILVDGKVVCQGKPYCSKALTPGLHKVQMLLERHVTREEMVDTAAIAQIDWQLEEDFARLSVDTNPPGVEIVIDGTPMGPGPHVDLELGVGAHVVKAGGDRCYKEHRKELRLNRGDVEKHTLEPVRKNAGLMVRASDDAGNDLMVDVRSGDVRLGRSFEPLTIGLCTPNLNIRTEDDRSLPINVSLDENQMQEVQITVPRELSREEKRTRSRADRERREGANTATSASSSGGGGSMGIIGWSLLGTGLAVAGGGGAMTFLKITNDAEVTTLTATYEQGLIWCPTGDCTAEGFYPELAGWEVGFTEQGFYDGWFKPQYDELQKTSDDYELYSYILYGTGGALVLTGAALLIIDGMGDAEAPAQYGQTESGWRWAGVTGSIGPKGSMVTTGLSF